MQYPDISVVQFAPKIEERKLISGVHMSRLLGQNQISDATPENELTNEPCRMRARFHATSVSHVTPLRRKKPGALGS